jgi:hypothetical protein
MIINHLFRALRKVKENLSVQCYDALDAPAVLHSECLSFLVNI